MADVSGITAVRTSSDTITRAVTYGATVAAGDVLYYDPADNEYKLADADNATSAVYYTAAGIAVTPGVDGGYGIMATAGIITLVGATLSTGLIYITSGTAGKIAPHTDLGSTDRTSVLGVATGTTTLDIHIYNSLIEVP